VNLYNNIEKIMEREIVYKYLFKEELIA